VPAASTSAAGVTILSRRELHKQLEEVEELHGATLRELIIDQRRVDVLARVILGLQVKWHHWRMLKHQSLWDWCMALMWRGGGKTLVWQVVTTIMEILIDPNIRIAYGSRAATNAMETLDAVQQHFVKNERLRAVFGDFTGGDTWNKTAITVGKRSKIYREPTVTIVSPEGAVASKHCDIFYGDDLVDKSNSQTQNQRDSLYDWFWGTAMPIVEMDVSKVRISGTRYHPKDLYWSLGAPSAAGELQTDDQIDSPMRTEQILIIEATYRDDEGEELSVWEEKFPIKELQKRRASNPLQYEAQYNQNVKPMAGGGLIKFEQVNRFPVQMLERLHPGGLPHYLGVDLAIGKEKKHDEFWAVVGAYDKSAGNIYAIAQIHGHFTFSEQRAYIIRLAEEYDIVRGVVEAVAYQAAMVGELKEENPLLPIVGYKPRVDKRTRMERRTPLFEEGRVHVARGMDDLVGQLVNFTGEKGKADDGADAWMLMVRAIQVRKKKARQDFGLF